MDPKALVSTPIWILAVAAVVWLGRSWLEGMLKSRFSAVESRLAASMALSQGLRAHEQDELVGFRVAVEEWEYFLQTGIGDLTIKSENRDFKPTDYYDRDHDLFGAVRLAAVKAAIFLRDPDLEVELLKTINAIRGLYYPLLAGTLSAFMDLQGQMLPYLNRIRLYEDSGQKDTAIMLSAEEAQAFMALRHQVTGVLQTFSDGLTAQYRPIFDQLLDLKAKINSHIYRPVTDLPRSDA